MEGGTQRRQLIQEWIRPSPVLNRRRHIRAVLEIAEQPDHSRNIAGMIAPSQKAVSGGIHIEWMLLQRVSCGPVAERDGNRHLEPVVETFVAGLGINRDKVDCVLLALRPQALAADIGANRRQHLQTKAGEKCLEKHNRYEGRDKPQQPIVAARRSHHCSAQSVLLREPRGGGTPSHLIRLPASNCSYLSTAPARCSNWRITDHTAGLLSHAVRPALWGTIGGLRSRGTRREHYTRGI